MPKVYFHSADRKMVLKNKTILKSFILYLFQEEKKILKRLDYIFCSDQFLLQLNISALNHEYYTDILTFPLSEEGSPIEAEIYISIDRVKENSVKLNEPGECEMLRVMFHGALHLCGYNDHNNREIKEMRRKENEYISSYFTFVSRGTEAKEEE